MFSVEKELTFEAAHHLPNHKGKCKNIHGHTYQVIVEVEASNLNEEGMVVDFGDIKSIIKEKFDHKYLNDLDEFSDPDWEHKTPTAENMAYLIWYYINRHLINVSKGNRYYKPNCVRVVVWETPTSKAEFKPQ